MTEFKLDTSGTVLFEGGTLGHISWEGVAQRGGAFAQGYMEAMLRAFGPQGDERDGPLWMPRFSDLAPATLARIISDTDRELARADGPPNTPQAGAAFWIGRNTKIQGNEYHATSFPPLTPTLADDGLIYFKESANK